MSNAVQKKETTAIAGLDIDLEAHAGAGMDQIGVDDMQMPFLRVVQALSSYCKKSDPDYLAAASQGDFINTVTKQLWKTDEGADLYVIPCGYTTKKLEFVPRDAGGGFQGEIEPSDPVLRQTTKDGGMELLPNGNEVVTTHQHLVLIVDAETGATQQAVMDLKKTGIKVSKRWNTQMKMVQYPGKDGMFNPPMWATVWKLSSVEESNDRGSWYIPKVEAAEPTAVPASAIKEAKAFFESFQAGEVKTAAGTADELGGGNDTIESTDVPF